MDMVLVFSRMKHAADRLARQLEQQGVRAATLHSNRSQNQRLRALKDFKDGDGARAGGDGHRGARH